MTMTRLLCLTALVILASPSAVNPKVALRDSKAPTSALARLPGGSQSLRFARARIGPGGSEAMLHFYAPRALRTSPDAPRPVSLDVLTLRRGRLSRLARIPLGSTEELSWGGVELRWLQPKKRQGPILLLPVWSATRLVVFPSGWSGRRFTQDFEGAASSISATYYEFGSVDARGFFAVEEVQSQRPEADEPPPTTRTPLRWNGKQFVQ